MNLMYFKNLRGDRDGGTTGLLSGSRRVTAGFDDGGSVARSYGVRGLGAVGGPNSRSWFNAGVPGGVSSASSLGRSGGGAATAATHLGPAAAQQQQQQQQHSAGATGAASSLVAGVAAAAVAASAGLAVPTSPSHQQQQQHSDHSSSSATGNMQQHHHLRTHPLGLFDLPRHTADSGSGYEDADRPTTTTTNSRHQASSSASRWSERETSGGGSGNGSRSDYRYTRVDRQRVDSSAFDSGGGGGGGGFNGPGGSRSVRSGLYAGEHQYTGGEVCLSVSGLRGGPAVGANRTGKQVSFGRHSPDAGAGFSGAGTMERERSRESDKRRPAANNGAGGSNKENGYGSGAEVRGTLPRSAIVSSKRPSPERLLAVDPPPRRSSSRGRNNAGTAETSLTLPDPVRMRGGGGGSGRRGADRDANRLSSVSNEPNFDELVDPKDVNLNELPRDYFILPVHLVNRFLPLGLTLPTTSRAPMSYVDVQESQLVVLLHFMTPFMAIQPVFESPLARPASIQGGMASQLLVDLLRDRPGAHGMLLVSIESDVDYPYINYGVASRQQTNGEEWQHTARLASLDRFEPQNLRYFSDHLVDVYEEAATIARPPLQPACRRPLSNKTGYIVCVYKVFDGDDGEKFERNWLYWTGARVLYQSVPRCVGLRRITLHKSVSAGDKLYTLVCECTNFMDHLQEAAYIAPALRARLCGYWSIYRIADVY